jgi:hypothetical protein
VRLNNWEFEIKFVGKRCVRIDLICEAVTFLASRTVSREITACHFKVPIVQLEADVKRFSPQVLGYLNRIGKRNLCEQSFNVNKEMKSLLSFATHKPTKVQSFSYRPWTKEQRSQDPMSTLTAEGKKVLEKLRHFITRQHIRDFILESEVSDEASNELRARILERP